MLYMPAQGSGGGGRGVRGGGGTYTTCRHVNFFNCDPQDEK